LAFLYAWLTVTKFTLRVVFVISDGRSSLSHNWQNGQNGRFIFQLMLAVSCCNNIAICTTSHRRAIQMDCRIRMHLVYNEYCAIRLLVNIVFLLLQLHQLSTNDQG